MKKIVLIFLLLVGMVSALNIPGPFMVNDAIINDFRIVVADSAPADDVIAAWDIAQAFTLVQGDAIAPNVVVLSSEVSNISDYNSIVLGNACYNPIIMGLLNNPDPCNESGVEFITFPNGNIALLVMGSDDEVKQYVKRLISNRSVPSESVQAVQSDCLEKFRAVESEIGKYEKAHENPPEYMWEQYNQLKVKCFGSSSAEYLPEVVQSSCMAEIEAIKLEINVYRETGEDVPDDLWEQYNQLKVKCFGSSSAEYLPEVATEVVQSGCMAEIRAVKLKINEYQDAEDVPDDLWEQYNKLTEKCVVSSPTEYLPEVATVAPPVRSLISEEPCIGCVRDSSCLQFGIRLIENGTPSYCDLDNVLKPQKELNVDCQNNYECLSNTCSQTCISFDKRLEAVEKELKEQRGLIEKILDFFKNLF